MKKIALLFFYSIFPSFFHTQQDLSYMELLKGIATKNIQELRPFLDLFFDEWRGKRNKEMVFTS